MTSRASAALQNKGLDMMSLRTRSSTLLSGPLKWASTWFSPIDAPDKAL